VTAQRISIEDGAFFKGGIDIRKPGNEGKPVNSGANAGANSDAGKPVAAQV
jgi:hypothetical protein